MKFWKKTFNELWIIFSLTELGRTFPTTVNWLIWKIITKPTVLPSSVSFPLNELGNFPTKFGMKFTTLVQFHNLINNCVMKLPSSWRTSGISNQLWKPIVKSIVKRTVNLSQICLLFLSPYIILCKTIWKGNYEQKIP